MRGQGATHGSSLPIGRLQQRHALGGNGLLAAGGPDAFAGLGLQANTLNLDVENLGQALPNRLPMWKEFWTLREDDTVDVDNLPAQSGYGVERNFEHFARETPLVFRVRVGKHLAYVAQRDGAEQRVDHGMHEGVGVAMANRLPIMRNIDAAQA